MNQGKHAVSDVEVVKGSSMSASQGARRATGEALIDAKTMPEPEVVALPTRRRFSMGFKRRVVHQADACQELGEVGALLRREGLYSSHLCQWRKEVQGEEAALGANKRGPKPDQTSAQTRRTLGLEREVSKLRGKLQRAEQIIEVQKKLCELLGLPSAEEAQR